MVRTLDVQLPLQGKDVGADGGLRQVQQLARLGKAAGLHHINERFQLLDIHKKVSSLVSLCGRCYNRDNKLFQPEHAR